MRRFDSGRGYVENFHFAVYRHTSGILMVSVDSLMGFLKDYGDQEVRCDALVEMLEGFVERAEEKGIGR